MAKAEDVVKESWGTWEELLLACAVNRHGTNSWDSVAMEIQNRNTSLRLLTPQNCKQKYHDLKHRFMAKDDKTVVGEDKSETSDDKKDVIPWLEELRKLRVAELRREVQRHDVSIVSLQLKVKRLKEEREQSLKEKEHGDQKPDLETNLDGNRVKEKDNERDEKPEKSSSENVAEAAVAGDESDRENQSFNESNSTDPKAENREKGVVDEAEKKPEPVEPVPRGPDPVSGDSKPIAEGSYHGSSETIAKESMAQPVRKSRGDNMATKENDSPELLGESVAESKGVGEEGHKESSDVQSSASLSRKNRRKKASSGSSSGEERENDEVSPAIKRISDQSEPLMSFLAIIRSHKCGSVFECRLESQETSNYRNLIRHHVDLEMVQARLEEGRYNGCSRKFFRDLLLLFNNAIVFFPKESSEWIAAVELRKIVSKELANRNRKLGRTKEEKTAAPETTVPSPVQSKPESEPEPPKLAKPKSSAPIVACRKRSSISTKPSSAVVDKKAEPKPASEADEKQVSDRKRGPVSSVEEEKLTKKRTRERSALGARSSRARSQSRSKTTHTNKDAGSNQNTAPGPNSGSSGRRTSHDEEAKSERKNNDTVEAVAKKRSAASFLNRMKRNSNGTLLESLKNSVNSSENDKSGGSRETEVGQKRGGVKGDRRKDHGGGRRSSAGKQSANQNSPVKRSVGRPPKRATAPPRLPPPAPTKRTRETVQTEVVASRQSRKRTRR